MDGVIVINSLILLMLTIQTGLMIYKIFRV